MTQRSDAWKKRILRRLEKEQRALSVEALLGVLKVRRSERPAVLLLLEQMELEGELRRTKKGKLKLADSSAGRPAVIVSLSHGFAFARLEDTGDDCFVPGRFLRGALPGDRVRLRVDDTDRRGPSGRVIRIEEEGDHTFTGRVTETIPEERGCSFQVVPDRSLRISLPVKRSALHGAAAGDKVRFAVRRDKKDQPTAEILTVYGSADSARVCADSLVDSMGIPSEFREEVKKAAGEMAAQPLEPEGREDLRDLLIFTIDGEDAKDLDDAVSLQKTENGWILGVHIADVSHYVRSGTLLDSEARRRGTSVYFADRVIPMLPEALSNGACSLHPGGDKLALSTFLTFGKTGKFLDVRVVKSVIRSRIRGVYSEVNELFDGTAGKEVKEKYKEALSVLRSMRALARKLKLHAVKRGVLDFASTETRFVLDKSGAPVALYPRTSGEAEEMIEQFMIAANTAVAQLAREKHLPFVYRIHEDPDGEKLEELLQTARLLGIISPEAIRGSIPQALVEASSGTPYARLISSRLLRCMAKARYDVKPLGHYGLGLKDYCHFTSPIRRYPDLSIHRILSDYLSGVSVETLWERYGDFTKEAADRSTACEIRAVNAERSCDACYKAEYMSAYIGRTFTGSISSLSESGFYVELPNTVEGMIRLESLPQTGVVYDGVVSLTDHRGHPLYTIGEAIEVTVASCDISAGHIAFVPA